MLRKQFCFQLLSFQPATKDQMLEIKINMKKSTTTQLNTCCYNYGLGVCFHKHLMGMFHADAVVFVINNTIALSSAIEALSFIEIDGN